MSFIIVYITHPDEKTAKKIGGQLIEKRLVACSNTFPVSSSYWWNGHIENTDEWVSIVKTRSSLWEKVKDFVASVHPYNVPCIIKLDAEANGTFEQWIYEQTNSPDTA